MIGCVTTSLPSHFMCMSRLRGPKLIQAHLQYWNEKRSQSAEFPAALNWCHRATRALSVGPSMSAEQMPLKQGVLNKTIEQKMYSPSAHWTNQQLNNCRLNTEQNTLNKFSIEQHPIEHLHYWTVVIWTLPKNQLNKIWIEQDFWKVRPSLT